MTYETESIYLLKRWDSNKGVEHYAVGLKGWFAWQLGSVADVVVQLLPSGITIESWLAPRWETLESAHSPGAALRRLETVSNPLFSLLGFNCEHFARFVVTGKRESRQVQGVVLLACAVALVYTARR